jgi:hypothetical protein
LSPTVYWELGQGAELPSFMEDGKKLYVEGAGFPIVRDTTDFLRNDTSDANPLRGAVARVIGSGKSQSGRFLKTFLYNGFNKVGDRPSSTACTSSPPAACCLSCARARP